MQYRKQKNLTISQDQAEYIKANDGKLSISQLGKMLGIGHNKIQKNRIILGLVKSKTPVIQMNSHLFDVDKFGRLYRY